MAKVGKSTDAVKRMMTAAMFCALFVLSSYVHIPAAIPFTLQTAVLSFCLCILGCKRTLEVLSVYTLLGIAGIPVFSGFGGGLAVFANPSGGFIMGFFAMTLCYGLLVKLLPCFKLKSAAAVMLSLMPMYVVASVWYTLLYLTPTAESFISAVSVCVVPYAAADAVKVLCGRYCAEKLKKYVKV